MATPWPKTPPTADELAAIASAKPQSFWLDGLDDGTPPEPPLTTRERADLVIVGAGYTGLWAAIHAKTDQPDRDVVVLESGRAGHGASGRNGGFLDASLTHGLANGLSRFPDEMEVLERLARANYAGLLADVRRHGIDCDLEERGIVDVMLEAYQEPWAQEEAELRGRFGYDCEALDGPTARLLIDSPLIRAAVVQRDGAAIVHPGKLGTGLRRAALELGVRLHEGTAVRGIASGQGPGGGRRLVSSAAHYRGDRGGPVEVRTDGGVVEAERVVLATNAYDPLVPSMRRRIVPVYDYVLMSEPLGAEQLASIGWQGRQGLSDCGNQFHYLRLTADDRILIGGYDAVYRYGNPVGPHLDDHLPTFTKLSQHFFALFPQLRGLHFTHRWGGPIDTCSRFSVFFGTAHDGRVAYAAGYTGLGVGATRFGARVALDLVDGRTTEATQLKFVRSKPTPFPPEPLRTAAIQLTRRELARADEREGRRSLWLKALDRAGLGFDS
ncbi:MAG: FAD-dependent oxidoreductase [Solirubrobacteraceae bacterium]|nr:FAD-dependent oxidoreductase [Solirubrobacteraceae bacterium]